MKHVSNNTNLIIDSVLIQEKQPTINKMTDYILTKQAYGYQFMD